MLLLIGCWGGEFPLIFGAGGNNGTRFEVEESKNWVSPTNSSTIADQVCAFIFDLLPTLHNDLSFSIIYHFVT